VITRRQFFSRVALTVAVAPTALSAVHVPAPTAFYVRGMVSNVTAYVTMVIPTSFSQLRDSFFRIHWRSPYCVNILPETRNAVVSGVTFVQDHPPLWARVLGFGRP
jgi:hypothetical protein